MSESASAVRTVPQDAATDLASSCSPSEPVTTTGRPLDAIRATTSTQRWGASVRAGTDAPGWTTT